MKFYLYINEKNTEEERKEAISQWKSAWKNKDPKIIQFYNYLLKPDHKKLQSGQNMRLFLPFIPKNNTYLKVLNYLDNLGYKIYNYINNQAIKKGQNTPKDINQLPKISKLIKDPHLRNLFTQDSVRQGDKGTLGERERRLEDMRGEEFEILISRNPLDIKQMSSDKDWEEDSCMRRGHGNHGYVGCDIREGTLVVYLIRKGNYKLDGALARVLIKPYINIENPLDIYMEVEPNVYGRIDRGLRDEFYEVVRDWLADRIGDREGVYRMNGGIYADKLDRERVLMSKGKILELLGNKERLENNPDLIGKLKLWEYGKLPDGMRIKGNLDLSGSGIEELPSDMEIGGNLDLYGAKKLRKLGEGLSIKGNLNLSFSDIEELPERMEVGGSLYLSNTEKLRKLGKGLRIGGNLYLEFSGIEELSDGLGIGGDLYLSGTKKLRKLGEGMRIKGDLNLRNSGIEELPSDMEIGGDLYLYGTKKLRKLPENLKVGGKIYN